jgi:hypothetical protein
MKLIELHKIVKTAKNSEAKNNMLVKITAAILIQENLTKKIK